MTHCLNAIAKIVKLKVITVMMFSALIGMLITPTIAWSWSKACTGILGIGLAACGSAALNHLFDREEDKKMARTKNRPLAVHALTVNTTRYFAASTIVLSTIILYKFNNLLATSLTIATTIGYSIFYTRWLKPTTPQNIVIGGLSGSMPPLLGWTAITGHITVEPLLLVLIIFVWTPAHFWPLAIEHAQDYAKTKWPMLPVTHGIAFTKIAILSYAALTTISSLLPFCLKMTGSLYLAAIIPLNLRWLHLCLQLWHDNRKAMPVFKFSIVYIIITFAALLLDHQSIYHAQYQL